MAPVALVIGGSLRVILQFFADAAKTLQLIVLGGSGIGIAASARILFPRGQYLQTILVG